MPFAQPSSLAFYIQTTALILDQVVFHSASQMLNELISYSSFINFYISKKILKVNSIGIVLYSKILPEYPEIPLQLLLLVLHTKRYCILSESYILFLTEVAKLQLFSFVQLQCTPHPPALLHGVTSSSADTEFAKFSEPLYSGAGWQLIQSQPSWNCCPPYFAPLRNHVCIWEHQLYSYLYMYFGELADLANPGLISSNLNNFRWFFSSLLDSFFHSFYKQVALLSSL